MKRTEIQKIVLNVSSGLLSSVTDLTLFTFFLTLTSFGKQPTYIGYDQSFEDAKKLLAEINSKSIIRALIQLKNNGLITYKKKQMSNTLTVTPKGQTYLHSLLPSYKKTRHWDGLIFLITYDVPESQKRDRERLRKFLRSIGAGMLQDSVWVIFNNPQEQLKLFIEEKGLKGVVIISKMGKDATIGDEDLASLINRMYGLDKLNKRYAEFVTLCTSSKIPQFQAACSFLLILKDDPQLPFELTPQNWQGETARVIYESYIKIHT